MSATESPSYPRTDRTTPTRARERVSYDRALVHSILDAGYLCHLGFVAEGRPVVLPTLYARLGERLYLHGSSGARALRGSELPVCVTVTHVDGLVLARSAFHHSINYRSVVVHGTARRVTDEALARTALDALVDSVVAGRAADCRPASAKELAATAVLELDLTEVSAKARAGGPNDAPEDLDLPHWSGVLPVRAAYGPPLAAEDGGSRAPLPDYLRQSVGA
ncbi:pyridoxamine 5'-phosphate oxidase family protein [Streptomyces profundus]|uniref:pyridoxamine 5'-phosphate oxidase family protein n=1 Tax=Streptomyces profundus TaxID=2867410 RepID=UPI001D161A93|nr:pyridoxamine 5'-phosphate oxidase family protein [Streptomyces sp. MA3_2.13]UED82870.1 pyridoxamine 5'-phosphate oxidase family protein [Streptomyces sp. MA3_2.13]